MFIQMMKTNVPKDTGNLDTVKALPSISAVKVTLVISFKSCNCNDANSKRKCHMKKKAKPNKTSDPLGPFEI